MAHDSVSWLVSLTHSAQKSQRGAAGGVDLCTRACAGIRSQKWSVQATLVVVAPRAQKDPESVLCGTNMREKLVRGR